MSPTNPAQSSDQFRHRFIMRAVEPKDATTIADWYQQIEDVSIFDRQTPLPSNSVEVAKLVEAMIADQKSEKCSWYIAESESGEVAGMAGLEMINPLHGNAILPVFIAPAWRRSGVGVRMCAMVIDLAFRQLRLHRVATLYRSDNRASRGLVEACGFKEEGVSRESWFSNGQYYDVINVGILAHEWEETRLKLSKSLGPDITLSLGPRASSQWTWPLN